MVAVADFNDSELLFVNEGCSSRIQILPIQFEQRIHQLHCSVPELSTMTRFSDQTFMKSIEYLKPLIAYPSVSCTSNEAVSRWVEHELRSLGFETEWLTYIDAMGETKVCVTGRLGRPGEGLAYFCHTDVVPVDSWDFPQSGPWEPTVTDDRVYGRGSCDMKGSLACMLAAVESLDHSSLTNPLYVVCTADEETGLRGARELVAESKMYREIVQHNCRAIIGEPTSLEVVHAHKGGRAMKITAHGSAAHSSTGKGRNANMDMIPFLAELHKLSLDTEQSLEWQDSRFEPPTINVNIGINDHTHALNITPPQSVCTIYFRVMPDQPADDLVKQIQALAENHNLDFEILFTGDALFTDPNSPFINDLLKLTQTNISRTVAYGTDGSCFTELDRIAVIGPGDIRQAHTDDEWISIDQLSRGTDLYRRMIETWCMPSEN